VAQQKVSCCTVITAYLFLYNVHTYNTQAIVDVVSYVADLLQSNYYPTLYLRWFRKNRQVTQCRLFPDNTFGGICVSFSNAVL